MTRGAESTSTEQNEKAEVDTKVELLCAAYDEVLDATKHQDDKIGRLLTAVAFLTAGTLALASLGRGDWIIRKYDLAPLELPLGLITFVFFLLGIFLTVVLLLMALSHPLRIPGLAESRRRPRDRDRQLAIETASQYYFFDISNLTREEWRNKWMSSTQHLTSRKIPMLIDEVHNLSGRTAFKYDRSREAVAILTLSLLYFASTVVIQAFSAVQSYVPADRALVLSWYHKLFLALLFGSYMLLIVGGPNRASRQSMEESIVLEGERHWSRLRRRIWSERAFTLLVALLTFNAMIYSASWYPPTLWAILSSLLAVSAVFSFYLATTPDRHHDGTRQKRQKRDRIAVGLVFVATLGLTSWALEGGLRGYYVNVLGASVTAVGSITTAAILQPTLQMYRKRRRYRDAT